MTRKKRLSGEGASLAAQIKPRLSVLPKKQGAERFSLLVDEAKEAGVGDSLAKLVDAHPDLDRFLGSMLGVSPFLRGLALADPARLLKLLDAPPEESFAACIKAVNAAFRSTDIDEVMEILRQERQTVALLVAIADLGGVWGLKPVTEALTGFAEAAISAAARFALADAANRGWLSAKARKDPADGSGWIILGMGKLGGRELNYSSDVDLIVLFDPERAPLIDPDDASAIFVRLTKMLVRILTEYTEHGYVLRTDLRLRPDPGSTQIAMSTGAAFLYYESMGQNWERAALIKARPVAGDLAAGDAFLAELAPFIWRKHLDYAAIADIHSIKRQIHDYRGHETVAIAGHNLKLGRGGIREIEFFVQTQQLVAGGRDTKLRGRSTTEVLAALCDKGWIDAPTRDDMTAAYTTLREAEHCLQMINDDQTHSLPSEEEDLADVWRMMGLKSLKAFEVELCRTLESVRDHYAALFEAAPSLTSALGSLVFTGESEDPETVATLEKLGFSAPDEASRIVRGWHHGRYPATRSSTARERLTEFVPALLETLAATDNADTALSAFDRFLARLPAGIQLFSLLKSNTSLLALIATILSVAPRMAETIVQRPHVLDALLEPAFFGRLPDPAAMSDRLKSSLEQAAEYEDLLDRARIFGKEQAFLIGVRVIAGAIDAQQAGVAFADLADLALAEVLAAVRAEFERQYGRMPGGQVALLGMGKLGGREMTASSDLDLILLYDFDERHPESDGKKALGGTQYFTRLTQRLIAALSAPTAEGILYEVDFRLRPSGKSGPLATHIDAFVGYQMKDAWTWEHMAMTRARVVAGDSDLVARATKDVANIVALKSEAKKTRADVLEMRRLIEEEKGGEGPWDIKQAAGGLVDIEFIAQYLQLVHSGDHPGILSTETEATLRVSREAGLLRKGEAETLLRALHLYQTLIQVLRLCLDESFDPDNAPRQMRDLLARSVAMPDFPTLHRHLEETEASVRTLFEKRIGKV